MLGRYDRAMRARQPVGRLTLLQQAIAAIRRNNGALFYVPQNFSGAWTDSAGTDPVNEIADVIGLMTDRTGGGAVATQATTANKPTVQTNAQGRYVVRFDDSNDSLTTNITTGNEGWVCAGVALGSAAVGNSIFGNGATSSADVGVWVRIPAAKDGLSVLVSNGALRQAVTFSTLLGGVAVVDGGWSGSAILAAANGVESLTAKTVNCSSSKNCDIGGNATHGWFLNGGVSAIVYCPVLPSAADRAIIRKWIGSLQGQTL